MNSIPYNVGDRSQEPATKMLDTPLLTEAEEFDLATLARAGNRAARDRLILANTRLAYSIAKKRARPSVAFADLFGAALAGLIEGADGYDPALGRFSHYVGKRIRGRTREFLEANIRAVRLPRNKFSQAMKVHAVMSEGSGEGEPSNELIAHLVGCRTEQVDFLKHGLKADASMNGPISEFDEGCLQDCIVGSDARNAPELLREEMSSLVDILEGREREVIRLFFGLDDCEEHSLTEIAPIFRCSVERVRQLKFGALRKLRTEFSKRDRGIRLQAVA